MPPEMFTQHPKVVNLQPNENLSAQVKEVFDSVYNQISVEHL